MFDEDPSSTTRSRARLGGGDRKICGAHAEAALRLAVLRASLECWWPGASAPNVIKPFLWW